MGFGGATINIRRYSISKDSNISYSESSLKKVSKYWIFLFIPFYLESKILIAAEKKKNA